MDQIIEKQKKSIELMNFLFTIISKSMEFVDKKIHAQVNALKFKISKDDKEAVKFIDTIQSSYTNFSALAGSLIIMAERKGHTYYYIKAIQKIIKSNTKSPSKLILEKLNNLLVKYREILLDFYNHTKSSIVPLDYFSELFDFGSEKNLSLKKVSLTVKKYVEIFKDRYVDLSTNDGEQIVKQMEAIGSYEHDTILNTLYSITGASDEEDDTTYFSMNIYGGEVRKWVSSSRIKHIIAEHTTKINMIQRDIKNGSIKKIPNYYTKIIHPMLLSIIGTTNTNTISVNIIDNICKQSDIYYPVTIQEESLGKILKKFTNYISELPNKYMNEHERKLYLVRADPIQNKNVIDLLEHTLNDVQLVDTSIVVSRAVRRFSDINAIHNTEHIKQQINSIKNVSKKPESNTRYKLFHNINTLVKKIKSDIIQYKSHSPNVTINAKPGTEINQAYSILKKYNQYEIKILDTLYEKELLVRNIATNMSKVGKLLLRILDPSNTDTCILHAAVNASSLLAHDIVKSVINKRFANESSKLLQKINSITSIGGVSCSNIYSNKISIDNVTNIAHQFTQYTS